MDSLAKQLLPADPGACVLEVRDLDKRLSGRQVLEGLAFRLQAGEVLGFLGANGAGKSTTMRILLSLVRPDRGTFRILDQEFPGGDRRVYARVGALVESADLYPHLRARENLEILAELQGLRDPDRLDEVLEQVGLADRAEDRVRRYSQGMRQRLGLAQAILHRPELLVLDEPMNGLDPAGMREMRGMIRRLARAEGMAVLFSSHLLAEVEQLADRVLVIHEGRRVACGSLEELYLSTGGHLWELLTPDLEETGALLAELLAEDLSAAGAVPEEAAAVRGAASRSPRPGCLERLEENRGFRFRLLSLAPEAVTGRLARAGLRLSEFRRCDSLEEFLLDRASPGEAGGPREC